MLPSVLVRTEEGMPFPGGGALLEVGTQAVDGTRTEAEANDNRRTLDRQPAAGSRVQ